MTEALQFVIITGLSGAGKSQAMDSFEDAGWFWFNPISADLMSVGVVMPRSLYLQMPDATPEEHLARARWESERVDEGRGGNGIVVRGRSRWSVAH